MVRVATGPISDGSPPLEGITHLLKVSELEMENYKNMKLPPTISNIWTVDCAAEKQVAGYSLLPLD